MKVSFTYEEVGQIVLDHVRCKMNFVANEFEFPSTYSRYRETFCEVTHKKQGGSLEQVPNHETEQA